jgi:protein SCO1/2
MMRRKRSLLLGAAMMRRKRSLLLATVALLLLLHPPSTARAQAPPPVAVAAAGFDQRLDNLLPLDLQFHNEAGQTVRLSDYVADRPVLLTFNYFHCTDLCPLMLDEMAKTVRELDFSLGGEYRVLTVSIDPNETTAEAMQKKHELLALYGRPDAEAGWHFLLGAPTVLNVLAQAAGLRYQYDGANNDYVHPLGVLVLTPQGRIARYLYGLNIPARDLRLALVEASQGRIGTRIDQVALLCYHYDPVTGTYSNIALQIAQWIGVATVAALALFLGSLWRTDILSHRQRDVARADPADRQT